MSQLADVSPEACDRCGNFAPVTRSFELALCAECVRKSVHEIARTPLDFAHVAKGVGQTLLGIGLPAALVSVGIELPHSVLAQYVQIPPFLDFAWSSVSGLIVDIVVMQLAWQLIRGRRRLDLRAAFASGFEALPRVFVTRFLAGIQILLLTLLLVVPGIWRAIVLYLATPVSLFENKGGADALARSGRLMKEQFWLGLLVAVLMLLPMIGVFASTAGVAIAVDVLHPEGPPVWSLALAFVGSLLIPIAILPATIAPVVIYAKLVPPAPDLR